MGKTELCVPVCNDGIPILFFVYVQPAIVVLKMRIQLIKEQFISNRLNILLLVDV